MKKAMFFNVSLVIITIIVLTSLFIVLQEKKQKAPDIGINQLRQFKLYQQAEFDYIFLDSAARLAAHATILELSKKGGSTEPRVLSSLHEFPDFLSAAESLFKRNLEHYTKGTNVSANYSIFISNSTIIGTSPKTLVKSAGNATYIAKLAFRIDLNYSFIEYELLREQLAELNRACTPQCTIFNTTCKQCISTSIKNFDRFEWTIQSFSENIVKLNALSPFKAISFKQGKVVPIEYTFILSKTFFS